MRSTDVLQTAVFKCRLIKRYPYGGGKMGKRSPQCVLTIHRILMPEGFSATGQFAAETPLTDKLRSLYGK
jgi:hypothetical protein